METGIKMNNGLDGNWNERSISADVYLKVVTH